MKYILQHIFTIIRICLGAVFIFGAATKLSSISPFENLILKLDIFNWSLVPYISRAIISIEFLLGICLILNIYIKKIIQITLYVLIGFSFLLIYLHLFISSQDNCNCFGEIVALNPIQSIIKNAILIVLILYVLKNIEKLKINIFHTKEICFLCVIFIFSFAFPFIANSPNTKNTKSNYKINEPLILDDISLQNLILNTGDSVNVTQNKHIICFASLTCKACKYAIAKLSSIHKKHQHFSIYIIFLDSPEKEKRIKELTLETGLHTIPYAFLSVEDFKKSSHNHLPFIVFIDNGLVTDLRNYDDLYIGSVFDFFDYGESSQY
ncbi:MAG: hypothetical protein M0R02_08565 [Bacteroidales bacterium]|nr:hypothetical protein [Bacteroidales bacterium]